MELWQDFMGQERETAHMKCSIFMHMPTKQKQAKSINHDFINIFWHLTCNRTSRIPLVTYNFGSLDVKQLLLDSAFFWLSPDRL